MLLFDLDFIACSVNCIIVITILGVIVTVARSSNSRDGIGGCSSSRSGGGSSRSSGGGRSSSSSNSSSSCCCCCCCCFCCCCCCSSRSHSIKSTGFNGIFHFGKLCRSVVRPTLILSAIIPKFHTWLLSYMCLNNGILYKTCMNIYNLFE